MRNSLAIATVLAFVATGAMAQSQNPPAKEAPNKAGVVVVNGSRGMICDSGVAENGLRR